MVQKVGYPEIIRDSLHFVPPSRIELLFKV